MKNKSLLVFIVFSVFTILSVSSPNLLRSKEPNIMNITINRTGKNVSVQFTLGNCFTQEMEEAILSGIPTTFLFSINLNENRNFWFDKKIITGHIKHTVKYDSLQEEFHLTYNGKGKNPTVVKDFNIAKKMMAEVKEDIVVPENILTDGQDLYFKIRAKLDSAALPFYLDYLLFFVSSWDFETDWYTKNLN